VRASLLAVLTMLLVCAQASVVAKECGIGNLGYNSYEGYVAGGAPLAKRMGPGVGYPSPSGDVFHRYLPPRQWGQ